MRFSSLAAISVLALSTAAFSTAALAQTAPSMPQGAPCTRVLDLMLSEVGLGTVAKLAPTAKLIPPQGEGAPLTIQGAEKGAEVMAFPLEKSDAPAVYRIQQSVGERRTYVVNLDASCKAVSVSLQDYDKDPIGEEINVDAEACADEKAGKAVTHDAARAPMCQDATCAQYGARTLHALCATHFGS